ncbi:MAG: UDP-N-acetylmuramoyl-L-alanyl-D-glutamate--2,6-diaminopimelate ligase [Bacteroidales bacterium]|jgi:UDP-N-acetylmuramoyl-L-alanyl-D-glutamate--2,6-diaminopimelate ligase|nr:UDP-N-acetylmuramoyl-L-alanyl-D-glutamate--2,6-diaminopimelate ligase [Bacteroidales bacterium]
MMKRLHDILKDVAVKALHGPANAGIGALCIDSRKVEPGNMFIARRGTAVDSHRFIPDVTAKGAAAVVCEELPAEQAEKVSYILVDDADEALGKIASAFYEYPSENLILCGVTGTNGKTTIVSLLHQLFSELGYACGLISTVRNLVGQKEINATHTTPDAISLNALFKEMVEAGCTYCFMEVSSHAIHQKRTYGLQFAGGIFTNITHDHLDYHGDFKGYLNAKKAFFDLLPETAFALVNADDKNGRVMLQNTKASTHTYSLRSASDFKARVKENLMDGLLLNIDGNEAWCRLIGEFNAYNLLAVYASAMLLEQEKEKVLTLISSLDSAEGRFEHFRSDEGITAVVDYAHTPDALKNVLQTINATRSGNEELITVIGAGGDRDRSKRPLMGKIAAQLSNRVILTSDNPRTEDPEAIISDMKAGIEPIDMKKTLVITSRKEAISTACALAKPGDIILVAGKGHEKYQEVEGVKHPFDDKEILTEILIKTA